MSHPNRQLAKRYSNQYIALEIITGLLVLLFVYTAGSKWADFEDFQKQLYGQKFSRENARLLSYLLPPAEVAAALLLLVPKTRLWGLWLSALLMAIFTLYMGMVYFGYYQRVPCSCGGVLKGMTFEMHFYFNLTFLLLAIAGLWIRYQINKKEVAQ